MRRAAVPSLLPDGDLMLGFGDQILGKDFDIFCTNCISLQYSVTVPYGSIVYLMMYILDFCTKVDIYIYLMIDIISYEMYDECDGWIHHYI